MPPMSGGAQGGLCDAEICEVVFCLLRQIVNERIEVGVFRCPLLAGQRQEAAGAQFAHLPEAGVLAAMRVPGHS